MDYIFVLPSNSINMNCFVTIGRNNLDMTSYFTSANGVRVEGHTKSYDDVFNYYEKLASFVLDKDLDYVQP